MGYPEYRRRLGAVCKYPIRPLYINCPCGVISAWALFIFTVKSDYIRGSCAIKAPARKMTSNKAKIHNHRNMYRRYNIRKGRLEIFGVSQKAQAFLQGPAAL